MVCANTSSSGAAAHVRELPERLASIRLGRRIVLGDDGITLYAPGQALIDLLILSVVPASSGCRPDS